jgi:hypothetical protein
MAGIEHDEIELVQFTKAIRYDKKLNTSLLNDLAILAS